MLGTRRGWRIPRINRATAQPFVAEHYRPEPKRKSRRNPLYERDRDTGSPEKTGR